MLTHFFVGLDLPVVGELDVWDDVVGVDADLDGRDVAHPQDDVALLHVDSEEGAKFPVGVVKLVSLVRTLNFCVACQQIK